MQNNADTRLGSANALSDGPGGSNLTVADELSDDLIHLMNIHRPIDLSGHTQVQNWTEGIHGGFAVVYKGLIGESEVAVKVIKYSKNRRKPALWEKSLERRVHREIRVWAAISHVNIQPFLGYASDFGDFPAMISPWCPLGDASDYLEVHDNLSFEQRAQLLLEVCEGLAYLHRLGVIHGDLKPQNVLINDERRALLTDFGLIRLIGWEGETGMTTTSAYRATPSYTAPELLLPTLDPSLRASMSGDAYAVGCLALEFLAGYPPYRHARTTEELRAAMIHHQLPATFHDLQLLDTTLASMLWGCLLVRTWEANPTNRLNISLIRATVMNLRDTAKLPAETRGTLCRICFTQMVSVDIEGLPKSGYCCQKCTPRDRRGDRSSRDSDEDNGSSKIPQIDVAAPEKAQPLLGFTATPMPTQPASQRLGDTTISLYEFGPRLTPHSSIPIRCLLPLLDDGYLLMGTDDGLSMLDVVSGANLFALGNETIIPALERAKRRDIWTGESICQMNILECYPDNQGGLQGVVLALVGPEHSVPEKEPVRKIRMYNLSSLLSVVKWTATNPNTKPLVIRGQTERVLQKPDPRRIQWSSARAITKRLKSIVIDDGRPETPTESMTSIKKVTWVDKISPPIQQDSTDTTDSWDLVEDLPLQWVTDYVSLAVPGSRLFNLPVIFYELWKNEGVNSRGTSMLAVVTRAAILLYETPKGERSFRFVKEFYIPLPAKLVTFIHQTSTEGGRTYGPHLSLFVIFEKKARLIRIADSLISNMELWDDDGRPRDEREMWLPMLTLDIPYPPSANGEQSPPPPALSKKIVLLSRGSQTHILSSPISMPLTGQPPLRVIHWHTPPSQISARVSYAADRPSMLQLVGFSDKGMEVVETAIRFIFSHPPDADLPSSKGKGKGRIRDLPSEHRTLWHTMEVTKPLCRGGVWNRMDMSSERPKLGHSESAVDLAATTLRLEDGKGIYATVQRGADDYRVIWLGDNVSR